MAVGADKYFVWDYSEKSDILNIHKTGKKVDGSGEFEDFTVDFDKNGNIIGIEITNASDFFGQIGIGKIQLSEIGNAEIFVSKRANYDVIWVKLAVLGIERKIPLPVPLIS